MEVTKACHTFGVLGCPTSPKHQRLAGVMFIWGKKKYLKSGVFMNQGTPSFNVV